MKEHLKQRVVAWLYPEMIERMEKLMENHKMKNHTEFVSQAVDFYIGYLNSQNSTGFLSEILMSAIKGTLKETENRQATNLFRLSVEMCMLMNLMAYELEMTDDDIRRLRGTCVQQVKSNHGKLMFEDAVHYQNGVPLDEE